MNDPDADPELAFHAYIFFGNVLNYLTNAVATNSTSELSIDRAALDNLNARVEPLTPADILAGISRLSLEDKLLLKRCCTFCLSHIADEDLPTLLGVLRPEAEAVTQQLL